MEPIGYEDPAAYLPHRSPMVLLDRVIEIGEEHAYCEVSIHPDSPFAEQNGVPAVVGMEYLAQCIGVVAGWQGRRSGQGVRLGFLLSVPKYAATRPYFSLGEVLRVEVTHAWGDAELMQFEGRIRDEAGGIRATAVLNVFRPEDAGKYLEGNA